MGREHIEHNILNPSSGVIPILGRNRTNVSSSARYERIENKSNGNDYSLPAVELEVTFTAIENLVNVLISLSNMFHVELSSEIYH
ncbi:MAG: hypothetical protein JWO09_1959 [Bacteroidetes bacterium]|nr:hypothetical protein [Bacteroidota bacterium]